MVKVVFKDERVYRAAFKNPWHPILIDIYLWIVNRFEKAVVTEAWRTPRVHNDVHSTLLLRAIDLRSWIYTSPEWVEGEINNNWIYDPDRPLMHVCILHDVGTGKHLHVQVHNNTFQIV